MHRDYLTTHKRLLQWYQEHARHDLPWRQTNNVYHIYLSEVMLQQTQVSRVEAEYFPRFLERFPTLQDLAKSSLEEVHTLWSGLGYYSRATNLHKTAQLLGDAAIPSDEKELQKLPGIGRYTASAICCFGYNQPVAVVDTNIKRVLKRFFALQEPKESEVWEYAYSFLNHKEPKKHNLALMDIGATICTPKSPQCSLCPLKQECQGQHEPQLYVKTVQKRSISMDLFFGIYLKDGKIAFVHSQGPMYKGLLILPSCDPIDELYIGSFKHAYTKYKLTVHIYLLDEEPNGVDLYLPFEEACDAHISSMTKKALTLFSKQHLT